ncbi:glutathione S-transferase family protein [soil metagenome]
MDLTKPTITAFKDSPDRGRGMARDMRVRWAFEEVNQPYDVKLVTFGDMKTAEYKKLQPFGQIPAYQDGSLVLFESGAIIIRIAETHAGLFPKNADARSRAIGWMFTAVNTVEQPIVDREATVFVESEKPWFKERLPILDERVTKRLKDLSERLGESDWLEGEFTAGDLMMVTVLRRLLRSGLMAPFPNLEAYVARGEARPAYQRAYAAQLAVFEASQRK